MIHFYMLRVTNMATVRNFEVRFEEFNVVGIRRPTSGTHARKWLTEIFNY